MPKIDSASSALPQLEKRAKSQKFKSFSRNLLSWYRDVKAPHPWRLFWEEHRDPYHVWVSEVMLQQTLIKVVTPLYIRFIKRFPTAYDLSRAKEEDLRPYVKGLGYYSRFDRLHRAVKLLCEEGPDFSWPQDHKEWKKLPGVGEYTASAISSIAFSEVKAVVDGNVERVFSRIFSIREPINSPRMKKDLQAVGELLICKESPGDYNQALMELGQTHCSKAEPSCLLCPVKSVCQAKKDKVQSDLPLVIKNDKKVELDLYALIVKKKGKVFLSKREVSSPFLKNRPGFPLFKKLEKKPLKKDILGSLKHTITHHKITLHVVSAEEKHLAESDKGQWISPKKLSENLMTSLDMKAYKILIRKQEAL